MAVAEGTEAEAPPRKSRLPLLLGLLLALCLGGGGFYAAYSGLLPGIGGQAPDDAGAAAAPDGADATAAGAGDAPTFVPIDPLVVMLGSDSSSGHLRFRAQLEVVPGRAAAVAGMMPRILDVLNGYLRAVPMSELASPAALVRLRAQMLRRIQLVTGDGAVRDLLVTEFVLN